MDLYLNSCWCNNFTKWKAGSFFVWPFEDGSQMFNRITCRAEPVIDSKFWGLLKGSLNWAVLQGRGEANVRRTFQSELMTNGRLASTGRESVPWSSYISRNKMLMYVHQHWGGKWKLEWGWNCLWKSLYSNAGQPRSISREPWVGL